MHTATLYAYTCAYRVDAVVEALYSYLGALARDACNATDGDEAFCYLGHLCLKKALEEHRTGA